nr:restriction endonuclease subunit S [uncultured Desulfobacter sp.]
MKRVQLGEIADVIAGQSPPSKTYNSVEDGLPFFQGKADFQEKYPKVRMWCNSEKRKEAEPGDILISVRAPVGSVNLCDRLSIIGRGLSAIRPRSGIHAGYLYYFFKINEDRIANLGTGSTFKSITQDILKKIKVPIPFKNGAPDLDHQTRIATLLSKVESLIARRKKSIADLDELLKSTFLEMFGDPVWNEKRWDQKPIDDFVDKYKNGLSPSKNGRVKGKVFTLSSITGNNFREIFKEAFFNGEIKNYYPTENDFLVCRGNGNINLVGKGYFFKGKDTDIIFPDTIISLTISTDKINKSFIDQLWKTRFIRSQIELCARTTSGIFKINQTALKAIRIICPPIEFQNQFAAIVEKIEILKDKYQNSFNDLETLYGALSQKAFNGELDLSRIPTTVDLKSKDIKTVVPQVGESVLTVQDKPDKTPETREQILHRLFNGVISDAKNGALFLDNFWLEAEEKLIDVMDEDAPRLGVADYDLFRDWLFEMLAQGRVVQVFNEQENRMEIRSVS